MVKSSIVASNRKPSSIFSPSGLLSRYEEFVTSNAASVGQIESTLRSLTYVVVPGGKSRESEFATESLYSGIQVLALYHDSLVSRAISQLPSTIPRRRETSHTRYTKYWSNERPLYRRVALVLQMIRYTELFWEMLARRRGEKVHRRVVVLIEAVKAICRFLLLRVTGSGLLVRAPLPEREADPRITEGEGEGEDNRAVNRDSEKQKPWPMPRTRLALPNLPDSADISSYLVSKALTAEDATPAKDIVHGNAGGKVRVAEMLYILCPLLYALILHRRRGKKRNWAPWVACVALEYFCRQLAKRGFAERLSGGLRALSRLEREELQMRAWHMGWWAFRGAFYDNVTRPWLKILIGKLQGRFGLDLVANIVEEYEYLWNTYHFATVSS